MLADNSMDLAYQSLTRIFGTTESELMLSFNEADFQPILLLSKNLESLKVFSDSSFKLYVNKQINQSKLDDFMDNNPRNKVYYPEFILNWQHMLEVAQHHIQNISLLGRLFKMIEEVELLNH